MRRYGVDEAETFKDEIAQATLRLVADRGADRVHTRDVVKSMGILPGLQWPSIVQARTNSGWPSPR